MSNSNEERRKMRFEQVKRMLNSDMTCAEWRRFNKVPEFTMYHWLRIFRAAAAEVEHAKIASGMSALSAAYDKKISDLTSQLVDTKRELNRLIE